MVQINFKQRLNILRLSVVTGNGTAKENYKYVLEKILYLKTKLIHQLSSMRKLSL